MSGRTRMVFLVDIRCVLNVENKIELDSVKKIILNCLKLLLFNASRTGNFYPNSIKWGFKFFDSRFQYFSIPSASRDKGTGFRDLSEENFVEIEETFVNVIEHEILEINCRGFSNNIHEASNFSKVLQEVLLDFNWSELIIFSPQPTKTKRSGKKISSDATEENILYTFLKFPGTSKDISTFFGKENITANDLNHTFMTPAVYKQFRKQYEIRLNFIDFDGNIQTTEYDFFRSINLGGGVLSFLTTELPFPFSTTLNCYEKTLCNKEETDTKSKNLLIQNIQDNLIDALWKKKSTSTAKILGTLRKNVLNSYCSSWSHSCTVEMTNNTVETRGILQYLKENNLVMVVQFGDEIGIFYDLSPMCGFYGVPLQSSITRLLKQLYLSCKRNLEENNKSLHLQEFAKRCYKDCNSNVVDTFQTIVHIHESKPLPKFETTWIENWYIGSERSAYVSDNIKNIMAKSAERKRPLLQRICCKYTTKQQKLQENQFLKPPVFERRDSNESNLSSASRSTSITNDPNSKKVVSRADKMLNNSKLVSNQKRFKQKEQVQKDIMQEVERRNKVGSDKTKKMNEMKEKIFGDLQDLSNEEDVISKIFELQQKCILEDACLVICVQTMVHVLLLHLQEAKIEKSDVVSSARMILYKHFLKTTTQLNRQTVCWTPEIKVRVHQLQILLRMEVSWVLLDKKQNELMKTEILSLLNAITIISSPHTTAYFLKDVLVEYYLFIQQELLIELYDSLNYPMPSKLMDTISPTKSCDTRSVGSGRNPFSIKSLLLDDGYTSYNARSADDALTGKGARNKILSRGDSFDVLRKREIVLPQEKKPTVSHQEARSARRSLFEEKVVIKTLFPFEKALSSSLIQLRSRTPTKSLERRRTPRKGQQTPKRTPSKSPGISSSNVRTKAKIYNPANGTATTSTADKSNTIGTSRSPAMGTRRRLIALESPAKTAKGLQSLDDQDPMRNVAGLSLEKCNSFYSIGTRQSRKGKSFTKISEEYTVFPRQNSDVSTSYQPNGTVFRWDFSDIPKDTAINVTSPPKGIENSVGLKYATPEKVYTPAKRVQFDMKFTPKRSSLVDGTIQSPRSILKSPGSAKKSDIGTPMLVTLGDDMVQLPGSASKPIVEKPQKSPVIVVTPSPPNLIPVLILQPSRKSLTPMQTPPKSLTRKQDTPIRTPPNLLPTSSQSPDSVLKIKRITKHLFTSPSPVTKLGPEELQVTEEFDLLSPEKKIHHAQEASTRKSARMKLFSNEDNINQEKELVPSSRIKGNTSVETSEHLSALEEDEQMPSDVICESRETASPLEVSTSSSSSFSTFSSGENHWTVKSVTQATHQKVDFNPCIKLIITRSNPITPEAQNGIEIIQTSTPVNKGISHNDPITPGSQSIQICTPVNQKIARHDGSSLDDWKRVKHTNRRSLNFMGNKSLTENILSKTQGLDISFNPCYTRRRSKEIGMSPNTFAKVITSPSKHFINKKRQSCDSSGSQVDETEVKRLKGDDGTPTKYNPPSPTSILRLTTSPILSPPSKMLKKHQLGL